jgi:tRNA(Ile)-lysidine synthase
MRGRPPVRERVARTVADRGLLDPGAPVLALASGGADSTLLVLVLRELSYEVRALHVAHGLRGDESAADAEACTTLCAAAGVPLTIVDGRVPAGSNLEARLREARRAAAMAAAGSARIATGHTASDRAETVLYRLATSGGVRALPALPHRAGPWVRPLLDLTREEVRAELVRRGTGWREDRSNRDRGPARNRIRHEVLPVLRGLNPAAEANLARAGALAADERELLDGLAAELVEADGSLDLARLRTAHPALQRLALREAASRAGVALGHEDVEALRTMRMIGVERRSLPGAALAERRRARLTFTTATRPEAMNA